MLDAAIQPKLIRSTHHSTPDYPHVGTTTQLEPSHVAGLIEQQETLSSCDLRVLSTFDASLESQQKVENINFGVTGTQQSKVGYP